jgi:hypothetical protein
VSGKKKTIYELSVVKKLSCIVEISEPTPLSMSLYFYPFQKAESQNTKAGVQYSNVLPKLYSTKAAAFV